MNQLLNTSNCSIRKTLDSKSKLIKLHYSNRFVTIPVEKIIRLEGDCNYTVVHTQNNQYVSSRTLKHFEDILDDNIFVRVHKSHIVNMLHIKDLQPACFEIKFEKGNPIEVSRRKLKEVVKKFAIYRFK
ncbi:LytR/AlgR family response regulator transcription factor [Emticicia sp. SJ17W-69]|uniref:LytR/AlgR family response regulator transcription factor n=1 Tax=Emticicia sp. SJ17W-69 TaxID=3421657 RepID=UPI003EBFE9BE